MNKIVLDISGHNGAIDFVKLKQLGVYGVMIKCTEGQDYLAPKFKPLYEGAIAAGLKVGAYHFLHAERTVAACKEGRWFGQNIEGLDLELGVALDIEDKDWIADEDGDPITETMARNVVYGFAQYVAKYGRPELYEKKQLYIYANKEFFDKYLTDPDVDEFRLWFANPSKLELDRRARMIQYSWTGDVEGVENPVDMNILYDRDVAVDPAALKKLPERLHLSDLQPEESPDVFESEPAAPVKAIYHISGTIGEWPVDLTIEKE